MLFLCFSRNKNTLASLTVSLLDTKRGNSVQGFSNAAKASEWARQNRPDIAFVDMDVQCRYVRTLIKDLLGNIPTVLCSHDRASAYDAIKLHSNGFVLLPADKADIETEIKYLLGNHKTKKREKGNKLLQVNCFGNFEVMKNGIPVSFKRKKSKELFAFLVDRRGVSADAKTVCSVLWENQFDDKKNLAYFYQLVSDIRSSLEAVGAGSVFIRNKQSYSVDASALDCDYYDFLENDPEAAAKFCGEYMFQYSWAESTCAALKNR